MNRGLALVATLLLGSLAISAEPPGPHSDEGTLRTGREIYATACASCHGIGAEGAPGWQSPDNNGELPAPPHNENGHTWRHSDRQLFEMIAGGWRDPFNKTQRLTMPAFAGRLKDEEIAAVITYLKTLWTPEQLEFQREKNSESAPGPMD